MKNPNSWYNNNLYVILLILFLFPIGIYALWKNEKAPKALKIVITLFIGFALVLSFSPKKITPEAFDVQKERKSQLVTIAYQAEQNIINNLKDPNSFELIDKDYLFLNDSTYKVTIRYSGTNSFNARIQNQYIRTGILRFNSVDTSFTDIVKFEK